MASCSSTSSIVGVNSNAIIKTHNSTLNFDKQKIEFINAYISKIDFKANPPENLNIDQLEILDNKRVITTNESNKDVVFKNKSIVRVQYKDHLHNNFIKSKVFYYDKDELVCIKVLELLPNHMNEVGMYQRTIYVQDSKPISDSDLSSSIDSLNDLVSLGNEYLLKEYSNLN